jgi:tRNA dimethylallyltransferase
VSRPATQLRTEPLLALLGPTASGKTEASLDIAEAIGAEIACLDSTLVYRGMDVGTAKPTRQDRARVPHHLLDLVEPGQPFTVAEFQRLARDAINGIVARGRSPLLVAGGGLYFRAVVDGLEFPGTVPPTRRLLEAEARVLGPERMYARLTELDPDAARKIAPANVRRTVRALEVAAITGRPFSSYAKAWERYPVGAVRAAGIDLGRDVLHRRIEERVLRMMPDLLRETAGLVEVGFGWFLSSSQAIGYAEAAACLAGRIGEGEAAARTIRRTKRLARHQIGWFRRDPRIRWFRAGGDGARGIVEELLNYLAPRARVATIGMEA